MSAPIEPFHPANYQPKKFRRPHVPPVSLQERCHVCRLENIRKVAAEAKQVEKQFRIPEPRRERELESIRRLQDLRPNPEATAAAVIKKSTEELALTRKEILANPHPDEIMRSAATPEMAAAAAPA
jgi:hypothetical protein